VERRSCSDIKKNIFDEIIYFPPDLLRGVKRLDPNCAGQLRSLEESTVLGGVRCVLLNMKINFRILTSIL
jgi:hypothetical protein